MSQQLPYIGITQSAMCMPPGDNISLALDLKILPESHTMRKPFFGIWLLDVSGSMIGKRIDKAKESLVQQINELPDETCFNLVIFESDVKTIIKNETISATSRPKIIEHINKIDARGGTALYTALKEAIKMMRSYSGKLTKKITLITDGEPGDVRVKLGDESDPGYAKYFLLAKEAREYKASIDTVGALGEHNVYLLYEIAKQSTGKYIFAENADELKTKMLIASDQATRIVFTQPSITIVPMIGPIKVQDAVQYKPTIIRMPFEQIRGKLKEHNYKTWLRSFEAGDTYQIIVKVEINADSKKITFDQEISVLELNFDFGKGLTVDKQIKISFSNDPSKYRLNAQINKNYAQLFGTAQEITEQTIKNDASATQRIQGDETKKI